MLSISNLQPNGLGLSCLIPFLSVAQTELLIYLLLVPGFTIFLLVSLPLFHYGTPLVKNLWRCCWATRKKGEASESLLSAEEVVRKEGETTTREDSISSNGKEGRGNNGDTEVGRLQKVPIWSKGLYVWLYILYFLYYGLANRTLEVFNCNEEPVTRIRYMQVLPWMECSL